MSENTEHAGTKWVTFRDSKLGPLALIWPEVSRDGGWVTVRDPYQPEKIVRRKMDSFMTYDESVKKLWEYYKNHPEHSLKGLKW